MKFNIYKLVCFIVAAACLLFAERSFAGAGEFYLGGGAGLTIADFGDETFTDTGISFQFDADEEDTGFKFFVGYLINEHFGIEVAYVDLGKYDADITASGSGVTGSGKSSIEASGVSIAGTLGKDLLETFRVFGKVGILLAERDIRTTFTATGPGGTASADDSISDDGTELTAGVGVDWAVVDPVSIRAEAEYYDVGDDYFLFSLSAVFSFSIN